MVDDIGITEVALEVAAEEVGPVDVVDLRMEVAEEAEEAAVCPGPSFWLESSTHVVFPAHEYPKGQHWLPHNGRIPVRSVVFKAFSG